MRWSLPNGESDPLFVCSLMLIRINSILCGDLAIKSIEEPFISDADDSEEWAI